MFDPVGPSGKYEIVLTKNLFRSYFSKIEIVLNLEQNDDPKK